jgi:hypothetical protein
MITPYAEKLLARQSQPPPLRWEGWQNGNKISLKLIDKNDYGRCLVEWPDGMVREMPWVKLNREFKAVGME